MNRVLNIYDDALMHRYDVVGEGLVDLARATTRSIARLTRSAQTARQRRALTGKLNALSGHLLRDIGLTREDIPHYVTQAVISGQPSPARRAGQALRAAQRAFKAWREARNSARQLGGLNPRQLRDIGLDRSDIDWWARDLAERTRVTPSAANDNRDRRAA